jgi:hypothetical protein
MGPQALFQATLEAIPDKQLQIQRIMEIRILLPIKPLRKIQMKILQRTQINHLQTNRPTQHKTQAVTHPRRETIRKILQNSLLM